MDDSGRALTPGGFSALSAGTVLDRYRIDSVIAAGGFGITYLCHHTTLGKPYALKEHFPRQFAYRDGATMDVRPTDAETFSWTLDRFLQEGRALASCHHPNVVSVADVFEANQTAYMVLGYEEGRSLKSWLEMLGRAPTQDEIDAILAPLLDALAYVHGQGLLHRDIAPDNIMIRSDGKPCLIDFGSARQAVAERSQVMSALVKSGYSPPEQYTRAGRMQGPWSDVYAMGATLYRMVTGKTLPESTDRSIEDEVRPVSEMISNPSAYRAAFLDGVDKALVFHYAKRPQSIAEWRGMLMGDGTVPHAAAVPPPSASTGPPPPPIDRPPDTRANTADQPVPSPASHRGSKNRRALTVLAAMLVIGGVGYAISSQQSTSKRAAAVLKAEDVARVQREKEAQRTAKEKSDREATAARQKAEQRAEAQRTEAARAAREKEEAERTARARAAIDAARLQAEKEAEESRAAEARRKRLEEEQRIAALRAEGERLAREIADAARAANTTATELFNRSAVPSFNCDTYAPKPIDSNERNPQTDVLCISVEAADADRQLGDVYRQRISGLSASNRRLLIEQQRAWILRRNQTCTASWSDIRIPARLASVVHCLVRETDIRRRELAR